MRIAVAYLASLLAFAAVDLGWLSLMAGRFYRPILGDIALQGVNLAPALVFYLVFPIGLIVFAVVPALKSGAISVALLNGALFGALAYATYDLTNQATLRNWSTQLSIVDMAWGMVLSALASLVGYVFATRFAA